MCLRGVKENCCKDTQANKVSFEGLVVTSMNYVLIAFEKSKDLVIFVKILKVFKEVKFSMHKLKKFF